MQIKVSGKLAVSSWDGGCSGHDLQRGAWPVWNNRMPEMAQISMALLLSRPSRPPNQRQQCQQCDTAPLCRTGLRYPNWDGKVQLFFSRFSASKLRPLHCCNAPRLARGSLFAHTTSILVTPVPLFCEASRNSDASRAS